MPKKSLTGMGSHQSSRMVSDVWLTPPHVLATLGEFDLDPCSLTDRPWPTARRHIFPPADGLAVEWPSEERVFLNPPYSREVRRWLAKLAKHGNGIALTFARTETSWFVETIWKKASSVLFLEKRLHFYRPDGTPAPFNGGAPSCLVAYGQANTKALLKSGLPGYLVTDWAQTLSKDK